MNNYKIEKMGNSYLICFDDGLGFYDVPKEIIDTIKQLEQENKELHNKIDKLEDKIKQMDNRFRNGLCVDNYLGGRKTRKLFEEMFEILKDSDVDE